MIRTNIYLSEKQKEQLDELARETDIKVAEHIRRAVDAYLDERRRSTENNVK